MARVSDTLIDTIFDGRYRIVRRLGAGGMANVYLAEDAELGRRGCDQDPERPFANDELFVERFQREAKSAASLSHPNIVSIYDRGEAEGTYYIAMEVVEGKSLKEVIRTSGRLRPAQAIAYTRQILSALRFAHRNGIVHRDIKPHNILIGPEERLKVTDFGIARAGASQMTETGLDHGHRAVPLARAGAGRAGHGRVRSLLGRHRALRDADWRGAVHGRHPGRDRHEAPERAAASLRPRGRRASRPISTASSSARWRRARDDRYASAEELDSDLARIEAGLPVAQETTDAATAVLAGAGRRADAGASHA